VYASKSFLAYKVPEDLAIVESDKVLEAGAYDTALRPLGIARNLTLDFEHRGSDSALWPDN
jgi:hypothetical protein